MRHRDDRGGQRQVVGVAHHVGDEAAVDLHAVHRHPAQMAQPGEPGAEIVEPDLDPHIAQAGQDLPRLFLVGQHRGFGQFDMQRARRQTAVGQRRHHVFAEIPATQLTRGHVDRHEQLIAAFAAPAHRVLAGGADHRRADGLDQAALLGDIDEHRGRDLPVHRMLPAQQRFGAEQGLVGNAIDRLVDQAQFAALPGAAQVLLDAHPAGHRLIHGAAVEAIAVLAGDLRLVHRDVAVLHQHGRAGRIFREQGDADRRAEEDLAVLDHDRPAQLGDQGFGQMRRTRAHVGLFVLAVQQDDEFVAAETRELAGVAADPFHRFADAVGELDQHLVADVMAEGVVDALEIVDVREQQRELASDAAQLHQAVVEGLAEGQAIGQAGQRIGVGHAPHVAVVARDAVGHPRERAYQRADLVLAAVDRQHGIEIAGLDLAGRIRELADRAHQRALQQQAHQHRHRHQQQQQQTDPGQMAFAQFAQAFGDLAIDVRFLGADLAERVADANAAEALVAQTDRRGDVHHRVGIEHLQAVGRDDLPRQRIGHLLAERRDIAGAVVDDAALGVVDQHVAHVGLIEDAAGGRADGVEIEVVRRIHQHVRDLRHLGFAALAQAVVDQRAGGVLAELQHVFLGRGLALPDQHDHRQHHHHGETDHRHELGVEAVEKCRIEEGHAPGLIRLRPSPAPRRRAADPVPAGFRCRSA